MFSPRPSSPSPLPAKRGQRWSVVVGCTYEKKKRAWLVNRTKGWARKEIFPLLTPRHPSNWWMTKYNFIPSRSIKLQNYPATSALRLLALRSKRNFKSEREKNTFLPPQTVTFWGTTEWTCILLPSVSPLSMWELPSTTSCLLLTKGQAPLEHSGSGAFLRTLWKKNISLSHHSGFPSCFKGFKLLL